MDKKIILILVLLVLISVITIFYYNLKQDKINIENKYSNLYKNYKILENKLSNLEQNYIELNDNYSQLIHKYNLKENQLIDLKNNYINLEKEQNQTIEEYDILLNEYNDLINDLNNFREEINSSMQWFKKNSQITNFSETKQHTIKTSLNDCIVCDNDICNIKLACIYHKNKNVLKLTYSLDKLITNQEDKLQDLQTFLDNKKGDCEDFSLLFSAELRYVINELIQKDKHIIIEPIIFTDTKQNYYIDNDEEWYIDKGVEGVEYENYIYPYVACGRAYDPNSQEITGHCFNIISKSEIRDFEDLKNINAIAIEPQTGELIGEVNKNITIKNNNYSIYLIDTLEENRPSQDIYMIITENNLIYNQKGYFFKKESKWQSYNLYLEKVDNLN